MSAATDYVDDLSEGAGEQANAFRFYAAVTRGDWPSDDPDFEPNPDRAAELDAKAEAEEANQHGWSHLSAAIAKREGEVEDPEA